jgi:hypothetical protein
VNEGSAPPYTLVNDPTVYLRTGNVTTPLTRADADIVRDLHAKRANAAPVRAENVARARALLLEVIEQNVNRARLLEQQAAGVPNLSAVGNRQLLTAYLQPFYPHHELATPRTIDEKLHTLRVTNRFERLFPDTQMTPIARGILCFHWSTNDLPFSSDQVYANGLFYHAENTVGSRFQQASEIHLADIARVFYMTLFFGRKFYTELGYNGLVRGGLGLENTRGRSVRKIVPMGAPDNTFPDERPVTLESDYIWPIEADTHQLCDDDWVKQYFIAQMREIYWDLGYKDVADSVLQNFITQWAFR